MKTYQTIEFSIDNKIGTITLNRPDIHNAFNETMIAEIIECFEEIEKLDYKTLRVVILQGKGKSFCAGADLNWMKGVANYSYEENYLKATSYPCVLMLFTHASFLPLPSFMELQLEEQMGCWQLAILYWLTGIQSFP